MNYITEIKKFYDCILANPLSAGQISLWHAIMEIANRSGWQEWFRASEATMMSLSGLSRNGMKNAVDKLISSGYLEKENGLYKISLPIGTRNGTQDGTRNGTKPEKHIINNKTKLNETKHDNNLRKDDNYGKDEFEDTDTLPTGTKL